MARADATHLTIAEAFLEIAGISEGELRDGMQEFRNAMGNE
jgi:hypothetical protein